LKNGDVLWVASSYKLLHRICSTSYSTDGNLSQCDLVLPVDWGGGDPFEWKEEMKRYMLRTLAIRASGGILALAACGLAAWWLK
jgi:hypothetical protein